MANKLLDSIGLKHLWSKIKSTFVKQVDGKGLSTNDYTTFEKNKLSGIAEGADVNVQSDWNATSGDAFIKNKPNLSNFITKDVADLKNYTKTEDLNNLLNEKQNVIDSNNKLSKDLVSGLGTASTVNTGTSNGNVPVIGTNGKLPSSVIPASAITDTFVASSQSAMLGLSSAEVGDVCVRTDLNKSFILKSTPYSTLANWQELLTPTDSVISVNGQTGAVNLTIPDVSGYLPLSGGQMTGKIALPSGESLRWKASSESQGYYAFSGYSSNGDEGVVFNTGNNKVSWVFRTDGDTNINWNTGTPTLHMKNKTISINKLISGANAPYTLDVGGTANATTIYQNGKQVANKEDIPTNNNQLTNGAGYVTSSGSVATATNATKLNNQDASYYLNYNNLSNKPTIPTTYIKSASQSTTSASQFIDVNGDRTTTTLTDASGGTKSITSWVYQNAVGDPTNATTGGKAGLMSASDKNKLDSIDTSNLATKNDLPTNPLTLSTQSSYNCNVLYDGKVWLIANGSNCPSGSPYGALFTMPYRKASGNASPDFGAQIFIPNGDDATKPNSMFFRTSLSSSWNSWQEVAVKNDLGTQATFSLSGTTLTITPK